MPDWPPLLTVDGLVTRETSRGQQWTVARILASLCAHHVPLFARIDHRAAAATIGLTLPPTEVLIFGNPQAGTPLMQAAPAIALDLPLKLLVQTVQHRTRVSYNDPAWLAARYNLPQTTDRSIAAMRDLLATIVNDVVGEERDPEAEAPAGAKS